MKKYIVSLAVLLSTIALYATIPTSLRVLGETFSCDPTISSGTVVCLGENKNIEISYHEITLDMTTKNIKPETFLTIAANVLKRHGQLTQAEWFSCGNNVYVYALKSKDGDYEHEHLGMSNQNGSISLWNKRNIHKGQSILTEKNINEFCSLQW